MELEWAPLALRDTLEASIEMVAANARRRGLEVAYGLAPPLAGRRRLLGDSIRIRQVRWAAAAGTGSAACSSSGGGSQAARVPAPLLRRMPAPSTLPGCCLSCFIAAPAAPSHCATNPQVLANLLSNAVKFTHQGEVVVDAWVEEEPPSPPAPGPAGPATSGAASQQPAAPGSPPAAAAAAGQAPPPTFPRLHVAVRDTGIGIAPDALPTLFQSFRQVCCRGAVRRFVHGVCRWLRASLSCWHPTDVRPCWPRCDRQPCRGTRA